MSGGVRIEQHGLSDLRRRRNSVRRDQSTPLPGRVSDRGASERRPKGSQSSRGRFEGDRMWQLSHHSLPVPTLQHTPPVEMQEGSFRPSGVVKPSIRTRNALPLPVPVCVTARSQPCTGRGGLPSPIRPDKRQPTRLLIRGPGWPAKMPSRSMQPGPTSRRLHEHFLEVVPPNCQPPKIV